jgi:two-component system alkaline phosphatase synthesis response regulator PhoP
MAKILVVDDEEDIRTLLLYNLKREGHDVSCAQNGKEAVESLGASIPDLIILDVMMPQMDGIEFCEYVKANPKWAHIIICFLTARSEDYSQIAGLESGGDDYVTKPIKPKVLVSRINALLRRNNGPEIFDNNQHIKIDRERYLVIKDGVEIHLPRKEFELLALLASKPTFVFNREAILTSVWGTEIIVGDRTIDVHIRKIREKIGSDLISTVKGVGYKFNS